MSEPTPTASRSLPTATRTAWDLLGIPIEGVDLAPRVLVRPVARNVAEHARLPSGGMEVLHCDLPEVDSTGRRLALDFRGQVDHVTDDVGGAAWSRDSRSSPRTPCLRRSRYARRVPASRRSRCAGFNRVLQRDVVIAGGPPTTLGRPATAIQGAVDCSPVTLGYTSGSPRVDPDGVRAHARASVVPLPVPVYVGQYGFHPRMSGRHSSEEGSRSCGAARARESGSISFAYYCPTQPRLSIAGIAGISSARVACGQAERPVSMRVAARGLARSRMGYSEQTMVRRPRRRDQRPNRGRATGVSSRRPSLCRATDIGSAASRPP